ncbi:MAG: hypothetical protein M0D54_08445 [Hyphomonadaceae bacterium JAD_PAG50586_4]|nr:MAG: hypothetical protein M0D54_08445 [Hyphomonadaceae bacterium JAD_PAG50586_4]
MSPKDETKSQKTLVEHARGIAALPGEKLAELKAFGAEKLEQTMAAFLNALPALRQAGYELREFEIELGITPKIIAHFMPLAASDDEIAAAREALRDNKIGASMLSVLRRAGDVHRQVKVPGFQCAHMEIDVGVIPAVRLRYRADDAI